MTDKLYTSLNNINFDNKIKTLTIKNLPFWRGIQKIPRNEIESDLILNCNSHGVIQQTNSSILKSEVILNYARKDYNFITAPPGYSDWANTILKKNIDFLLDKVDFSMIKQVLEIGAGSLHLANTLVNQYDISKYIIFDPSIKENSLESKIELNKNYFNDSNQIDTKVDLVVCISCLEHLPDPFKFLQELKKAIDPISGLVFLSFPDVERQLISGDLGVLLHEHISYFTHDSASYLMKKAGFQIIHSEKNDDTLRYILKLSSVSYDEGKNAEKLLSQASHKFNENIFFSKKCLEQDLSDGKKIAIHGACNATFNFLYLANFSKEENIWIFDSDKTKYDKYMTSFNKSISNSLDSHYKKMDKVYIGAMTFFDEIKNFIINQHEISENKILPLFPR